MKVLVERRVRPNIKIPTIIKVEVESMKVLVDNENLMPKYQDLYNIEFEVDSMRVLVENENQYSNNLKSRS